MGSALLVRVKANQPSLLESLTRLCAEAAPADRHQEVDRHRHGRQEHRTVEVFKTKGRLDPEWQSLIASVARVIIPQIGFDAFIKQYPLSTIPLMMFFAIVFCLCSEADAFVAASFVTLRPSAKLAFLVLGPMMDFKLYFMYTRVFRPRLIWTIFIASAVQVFVYTVAFHYLWQALARQLSSQ